MLNQRNLSHGNGRALHKSVHSLAARLAACKLRRSCTPFVIRLVAKVARGLHSKAGERLQTGKVPAASP